MAGSPGEPRGGEHLHDLRLCGLGGLKHLHDLRTDGLGGSFANIVDGGVSAVSGANKYATEVPIRLRLRERTDSSISRSGSLDASKFSESSSKCGRCDGDNQYSRHVAVQHGQTAENMHASEDAPLERVDSGLVTFAHESALICASHRSVLTCAWSTLFPAPAFNKDDCMHATAPQQDRFDVCSRSSDGNDNNSNDSKDSDCDNSTNNSSVNGGNAQSSVGRSCQPQGPFGLGASLGSPGCVDRARVDAKYAWYLAWWLSCLSSPFMSCLSSLPSLSSCLSSSLVFALFPPPFPSASSPVLFPSSFPLLSFLFISISVVAVPIIN